LQTEETLKVDKDLINAKVLKSSMVFTIIYSIFGLIIGILSGSQIILFDAVYNSIGLLLTYMSIAALAYIKKRDDETYPYGKYGLEPLIAMVQYAVILYLCITNVTSAIATIMDGGHPVDGAIGIFYGFMTSVFSIFCLFYLNKFMKQYTTNVTQSEVEQWKFGLGISSSIFFGFILSMIMDRIHLGQYTPYLDPILTIIVSLIFARTAILSVLDCTKELLEGKPEQEIVEQIQSILKEVNESYTYKDSVTRIGKAGGSVSVEVDYIIEPNTPLDSVIKQDHLREEMIDKLQSLPYEMWLNFNFMGDKEMADHIVE